MNERLVESEVRRLYETAMAGNVRTEPYVRVTQWLGLWGPHHVATGEVKSPQLIDHQTSESWLGITRQESDIDSVVVLVCVATLHSIIL